VARRPRQHQHLHALLGETRRLARRNRRRLDPHVLAEIVALQSEARNALESGDDGRIARASATLEAAASRHLEPLRPSFLREAVQMVLLAVALAVAVRLFAVEAYRIPSGSMVPTLLPGDVVLVSKSAYGVRLPGGRELLAGPMPARGDVIVFDAPGRGVLIKRVVGLPGERVELVDEQVYVDGAPQPRSLLADRFDYWNLSADLRYWHPQSGNLYVEELGGRRHGTVHSRLLPRPRPAEGPFHVPPGHLFVLGDNRDDSDDGRSDGGWYVPLEAVRGRAARILFSWGRDGWWPGSESGFRFERFLSAIDELPAREEAALRAGAD